MKRIAGLVTGILTLLFATQVWAQYRTEGMYLSGNIGFGVRSDSKLTGSTGQFDNDPAFVINGAIGTKLKEKFRVEGEIGYHLNTANRTQTFQDFNFSVLSLMGNAYIDIPTQSPLKPYLGAGLGFGIASASEDSFDSSDSDLVGAVQLMAGISYDISPKAALTFGYRYFTTTDPSFALATPGVFFETEYNSHDFLFGARFKF
jgi:opacity protein-like surface antigen